MERNEKSQELVEKQAKLKESLRVAAAEAAYLLEMRTR